MTLRETIPRTKRRLRPAVVRYRHRGVRPADAFLASFPRSGMTWLRFMLYGSITGRDADWTVVDRAIPYVGRQQDAEALLPDSGRLIQTHERFRGTPHRVVYLVRDARGVLPSYYRQQRRTGYPRDFDTFVDDFIAGRIDPFGSWSDHVRSWLGPQLTEGNDVLLVRFEAMRSEPDAVLRQILSFLGVDVDEAKLAAAISRNDLDAMKRKEREAPEGVIRNRREDLPFVATGSAEAWRDLDERHVAAVEAAAGDVLQRLGYHLTR